MCEANASRKWVIVTDHEDSVLNSILNGKPTILWWVHQGGWLAHPKWPNRDPIEEVLPMQLHLPTT